MRLLIGICLPGPECGLGGLGDAAGAPMVTGESLGATGESLGYGGCSKEMWLMVNVVSGSKETILIHDGS